jgi:hypothetical protein
MRRMIHAFDDAMHNFRRSNPDPPGSMTSSTTFSCDRCSKQQSGWNRSRGHLRQSLPVRETPEKVDQGMIVNNEDVIHCSMSLDAYRGLLLKRSTPVFQTPDSDSHPCQHRPGEWRLQIWIHGIRSPQQLLPASALQNPHHITPHRKICRCPSCFSMLRGHQSSGSAVLQPVMHLRLQSNCQEAAAQNSRATANCLATVSKHRHPVGYAIARRLGCSWQSVCRRAYGKLLRYRSG